ncbi:LuxR C-terminal-related transcriptional regulator [Vibrio aestuarianus]|uniref:LuxR C-terminal-related transcriptional regulator n=1 Tax=Vibrio aestuarianus TaxID=28171 RepID=UPI00237C7A8B|nr:LuxR C-terminal-related transcriptional regulator [Vibrio aestuarianus]MDE1237604.1 LuxR C-terminal-related transcriptional regulator [Vibrio aestuarianus]MDE1250633.1 LuxR C-terminal-related transcriptional regulator [Vibrio aestuarianus]MDE1350065.1 LuxR C-terminal-related transcriptional regulator [Vibrio aestuarianus]
MRKANYTRTIYFLCLDDQSSSPYIEQLTSLLALPIPQIEPEALRQSSGFDKHKILMIDYGNYAQLRQRLGNSPLNSHHHETILFNVSQRLTTDELLTFGHLKGLFYRSDSFESIAHGLGEIINGQNWLPRHVTSQLLHYYRYTFESHTAQVITDLTAREVQILRSLQTGASNSQMAESLFISEFTVKSHLYQIFKKLSVKKRSQAIAWANQNILS